MSPKTNKIIVPIHNLIISDDIGGEFRIGNVLFIY